MMTSPRLCDRRLLASGILALLLVPLGATAATPAPADAPPRPLTTLDRLERPQLEALHRARQDLARQRQPVPSHGLYEDFRAVLHTHAEDADHTKGTRVELLAAARQTGIQIVGSTDHRGPQPDAWRGLREGVLFLAGAETDDGLLWFPEFDPAGRPVPESGLKFLSHVEERYDAPTAGLAGMEIVNRHTDALLDPTLLDHLNATAADPARWARVVEDFRAYPDEFFAAGVDYRAGLLAKWDRELAQRPFTGIGANDAHQNVIFNGVTFDPYAVSFRHLTTHVLARELTETAVRESLRAGRAYVAHDWLCDPAGFTFGAVNNLGVYLMGDSAPQLGRTRLTAMTPVPARLKLFHAGKVLHETTGTNLTFEAKSPGAYRLEAWLALAGELRPWIYANPVYLRPPSLDDMRLPRMDVSPRVEVRNHLTYRDGPPDDAAKHQLDLYLPKGVERAPVFVFIHGGAWKYGDRSQYPALGSRFAEAGYLTVIPSYRLAPKHPFPAQIEDVAAAFAWTVRHIAAHGGDTNRIYVGGHSAGGHLSALLTLDPSHLAQHGLSPKLIRGTLALSGVFDLTLLERRSDVFAEDAASRRAASPQHHIAPGASRFLVTYCQWDYFSLPAQARTFHAALREADIPATLVYVPGENHISEMLAVSDPDDATVGAALAFMRD